MTLETAAAPVESAPSTEPAAPAEEGSPSDGASQQSAPQQSSKPRPAPSPAALMAANTRLSQSNAAIRKALGFEGRVSDEQVLAKITELSRGDMAPGDPEYDPAFDEERSRFIDREWNTATRVYGDETVALARNVQELALTAASPMEFLDELQKLTGIQQQPATPPAQQPAPPTPAQQRAADVAPEGDGPVSLTVKPEQDELRTGDIEGSARKLFGSLFGGGR